MRRIAANLPRGAAPSPAAAGFRPSGTALAVALALASGQGHAQPTGAQAIHGTASLTRQGNTLVVTTGNGAGTSHSAINWQSFSIPAGQATRFDQPSAASTSINRVLGNDPSLIFGTLSSNGKLVLVNPAGIAVGAGAVVDTAGFTASTLRMTDADALAARWIFGGDASAGGLAVAGRIVARSGDVVLIAPQIETAAGSVIQSPNGATVLAAGRQVAITGRGLEGIQLHLQAPTDQAVNLGTLQGDAVGIFAGTLRHRGLIGATQATVEGGKVVLKAQAEADIGGTVTASRGTTGGQVHATAEQVTLRSGALVDVSGSAGGGEALLGGGWQGRDARIANAQSTTVEAGSTIRADATGAGSGGTVVLWSDGATRFDGTISARGARGGDGGRVETSGKRTLAVGDARVDTRAPGSKTGLWLLDPTNFQIIGGSGTGTSYINEDTIEAATSDVIITAADQIETAGTFNNADVVLPAGLSLTINNTATAGGGGIDLTLSTHGSALEFKTSGGGSIQLTSGNSSQIIRSSKLTVADSGTIGINSLGALEVTGTELRTAGGSITLLGSGTSSDGIGISSSTLDAGAGLLSVTGNTSDANRHGVLLSGSSLLGTTGGVSVNSASGTVKLSGSTISSTGGNVVLSASGSSNFHSVEIANNGATASVVQNTGSGTISISGNLTGGGASAGSSAGGVVVTASTISAATGAITLSGDAGWTSGVAQVSRGVRLDSGALVKGDGAITMTGRVGSSALASSAGLEVASGATVWSTGGNVTLSGTLRNPSTVSGSGITIGGKVESGPSGQVTMTGVASVGGGSGTAVNLVSGSSILAGLGGITVTGTVSSSTTATAVVGTTLAGSVSSSGNIVASGTVSAASASGAAGLQVSGSVTATGAGTIALTGSGAPAPAPAAFYDLAIAGTTISTAGGDITLKGNRISIGSPVDSGAGRTTIAPTTNNRPITLGGSSETNNLNLSNSELSMVSAGLIAIGSSSGTGGLSISGAISQAAKSFSLLQSTSLGTGISQSAALTATGLNAEGRTVTLTNTGNAVGSVSGRSSAGAFQFTNGSGGLTVGSVGGTDGVVSSGNAVTLLSNGGNLTLTQDVSGTGTTDAVVLLGTNFINSRGASAVSAGTGRWLVYSTQPASNTFGGLVSGNAAVYNAPYASNAPGTIASGNRYVFSYQPTVAVTADALTKVYDATATFATPTFTTSGLIDASAYGDVFVQDAVSGSLAVTSPAKNVGTYAIGQGTVAAPGNGYLLTYTPASASVTPASLTVSGLAGVDRVYDATTAVALSGTAVLGGVLGTDVLSADNATSGTFASKNVGTGKAITTAITLSGVDAGNYVLAQPTGLTADVTPASLTVSGLSGVDRVYDTTTAATLAGTAALGGVLGSDVVSPGTAAGSFADKNAGTGKAITVAVALTGADAGNYQVTPPSGISADITPASLTVSGLAGVDRIYDSTTAATLSGTATLAGALGGDAANLGVANAAAGTFADKNVGTGKAITTAITLTGSEAGNYVLVQPGVSASITPASLAVSGLTGVNRVYDATITATLTGAAALSGVFGSDGTNLTLGNTGSGTFASKDAGTAKAIATSMTLGGSEAGNYVLVQPTGLSANVTPASLTVSGLSAASRIYDATTIAILSGTASLGGVLGTDAVAPANTTSGSFADKNAGTGKQVSTAVTLTGADAGNYTVVQDTSLTANITPASVTVSGLAGVNRMYDATTVAGLTGTAALGGVLGSDAVSAANTSTGTFASKNVGTSKAITTAITLTGADAGNYTVVQPSGLTADVTAASLTVSGLAGVNRVYDATSAAALSGTAVLSGVQGSDAAGLSLANTSGGNFADKNVGTGKAITTAITLSGSEAGNYVLVQPTGLSANVTPASVTVSGLWGVDRVYDATTAATLTGSATLAGVFGSDAVTPTNTTTGTFADRHAGTAKAIATAIGLAGADAGNYTVVQPGVTANITPAPLTLSAIADNRTYNGTTSSSATPTTTGLVGSDAVSGLTQSFASRNVLGPNSSVLQVNAGYTVSDGNGGGNYAVTAQTATGTLTPAPLTIGTADISRVYDGTTTATAAPIALSGTLYAPDTLSGGVATFGDRHVGTGKTVMVSGVTVNDGNGGANYSVSYGTSSNSSITVRPLSTWTGAAGNGLWGTAGNWDALPDGNNVLAVSIASGALVSYNLPGTTSLQSITSAGGLAIAGGTLSVSGSLLTFGYTQTAGTLSGAGSLTVTDNFTQSGGVIDLGGPVNITQAAGDLSVGTISAPVIALQAPGGAILQSGALVASGLVTANALDGVALNHAGNHLAAFKAQTSGPGAIELTNTGTLDLQGLQTASGNIKVTNDGGISSSGAITAASGSVTLTASGPLTINSDVTATGNVSLAAIDPKGTGILTLNGSVSSSAGSVHLIGGTISVLVPAPTPSPAPAPAPAPFNASPRVETIVEMLRAKGTPEPAQSVTAALVEIENNVTAFVTQLAQHGEELHANRPAGTDDDIQQCRR